MNTIIISYSFTGNNEALSATIAAELGAERIKITEPKRRTIFKIMLDVIFKRTPTVNPVPGTIGNYDLVIFMGPVWMGQPATPLRAYFREFKSRNCRYAFISISGGSNGENPKLGPELWERMGKEPVALIDVHIADLLTPGIKHTPQDIMHYKPTENDIKNLTKTIVKRLQETLAKKLIFISPTIELRKVHHLV